jgi:hypothetical protein
VLECEVVLRLLEGVEVEVQRVVVEVDSSFLFFTVAL